jgi:serine/threonine protein kinase, bacterial
VAVDKAGNLYLSDRSIIEKVDAAGNVSILAGTEGVYGFQDGAGNIAKFGWAFQLRADGAGNVYVADPQNYRVRLVSPSGQVSTLAGSGLQGSLDGNAAVASFSLVAGMAVNKEGGIFVADLLNNRIRKISK